MDGDPGEKKCYEKFGNYNLDEPLEQKSSFWRFYRASKAGDDGEYIIRVPSWYNDDNTTYNPDDKDEERIDSLKSWIKLSASCKRGFLPIVDHGTIPCPWAVTRYAEETLRDRIGTLSQSEALDLAIDLFDKLYQIHQSGFLGDIKPENIMHVGREWLFADPAPVTAHGLVGATPGYQPPETFDIDVLKDPQFKMSQWDVWQMGCVFYEMLTGVPYMFQMGTKAVTQTMVIPSFGNVPDYGRASMMDRVPYNIGEVIRSALEDNPMIRPSAREIRDRLKVIRDYNNGRSLESNDSESREYICSDSISADRWGISLHPLDGGIRIESEVPFAASNIRIIRMDGEGCGKSGVSIIPSGIKFHDDLGLEPSHRYTYLFYEDSQAVRDSQWWILSQVTAPEPVMDMTIRPLDDGTFKATWSGGSPVCLYSSDRMINDKHVVDLDELDGASRLTRTTVNGNATFRLKEKTIQYIFPVIISGENAIIGNAVKLIRLRKPEGLHGPEGMLTVMMDWPLNRRKRGTGRK